MKQINLREGARRQHRTVALLGALQCWIRGLDGLVFRRPELERLLGLQKFKETRVAWLEEDFYDLFPNRRVFITEQNKSINALLATRKPLREGRYNLEDHLQWCSKKRIQIADFCIWPTAAMKHKRPSLEALEPFFGQSINPDERLLTAYVSLLAAGLAIFFGKCR